MSHQAQFQAPSRAPAWAATWRRSSAETFNGSGKTRITSSSCPDGDLPAGVHEEPRTLHSPGYMTTRECRPPIVSFFNGIYWRNSSGVSSLWARSTPAKHAEDQTFASRDSILGKQLLGRSECLRRKSNNLRRSGSASRTDSSSSTIDMSDGEYMTEISVRSQKTALCSLE